MNKLMDNFTFIPYQQFNLDELDQAVTTLLNELNLTLTQVLTTATPTWQTVAQPLHLQIYKFNRIWGIVNHLMAVNDSQAMRDLYNKHQQIVSNFFVSLAQNETLYSYYNQIKHNDYPNLNQEQQKIIDNEFRDFYLSGISLSKDKQQQFKQIQNNLEQLSTKFAQNVLDATDSFVKYVELAELKGIPDDMLSLYKNAAISDGKPELYKITLHMPSYLPIMQYCENSHLREELYREYTTKASELSTNPQFDNSQLIGQILTLRHQKATLLGFKNYAQLSLYPKMANDCEEVLKFLYELADKSQPYAKEEILELKQFAADKFGINTVNAWDIPFLSEKLQQQKYSYSNHELKQYFNLEVVLNGLFTLIHNLYNIKLKPINNLEVWHEQVQTFAVTNKDGEETGYLYLDLYSRNGKQSGAWMDSAEGRYLTDDKLYLPIAYIICNFTPPTDSLPSLLTFDEVQTLFHEMGHALHHLLTTINHFSISGINGVEWDAVELPSQFMEYFAWDYNIIKTITCHITSREVMPRQLFDKLLNSRHYQAGLHMLRQLEFAIYDILLHKEADYTESNYLELLNKVRSEIAVIIPPQYNRFSNSFTHIFAGGYAAGYYSYKWAEVLATDIFSVFENKPASELALLGDKFKQTILSKGGLTSMANNFNDFMQRKPQTTALIKHTFWKVTPMDVKEALLTRKSVRAFLKTPVSIEQINQILDSAKYAPSGTNTQPWQCAIVTGATKAALDDKLTQAFRNNVSRNPDYNYYPLEFNSDFKRRRIECGMALYQTLGIDKTDKQGRLEQWGKNYHAFGAPVVLYIFADKLIDKGSFLDCGMFIQSVMLMATSLGLASCAQAALAEYPDIVRTELGYSTDHILLCGIAIGYEDKTAIVNSYRTSREALSYFTKVFE